MAPDEFEELMDIQRRMQSRIVKEQEMDQTLDILSIVNEMAPNPDQRLQKEEVLVEAANRGFSHEETSIILDKLIKDRILFEPTEGFIQKR